MTGHIKVAGSQRTVASPYVKVSGTWKPAVVGYVKVNGAWRIWHSTNVSDNFNRTNSATLGVASNGFSVWNTVRGSWGVASNQANSSSSGTTYALSYVQVLKSSTDLTVKVDMPSGVGTGLAFWVQDADNWWGAQTWENTTTTSSGCGCYYCASNGWTLSYQSSSFTFDGVSYPSGYYCYTTLSQPATDNSYYTGIGCRTPSQCDIINAGRDGSCLPSASCSTGYCYCGYMNYSYSCPSGYVLEGTTCYRNYVMSAYYQGISYSTSTTRRVRLLRAQSGSVSVVTQQDVGSEARSIQVTTSGDSITARFYASAGATGSLIATLTNTPTSPTKTTNVGILKGQTDSNQGSVVDNFSAE